jgi:ubiquinone/menaquinone biosynthesis C-methylase UbiE
MTQTDNVFDSADTVARWRANAERRAAYLRAATERMLDAAGVVAGARVLDLGTGTGDTAVLAGQQVGPQGRVLATDVSEPMLQAAAEAAAAAGLENVECQRQDAGALVGLEPGSFDSVIARFSLMFVDDLEAALAGIRRVLKPGGRLGALVWGPPDRNPFLALSTDLARRKGLLKVPETEVTGPFRLADKQRLARAAMAAGLEAEVEEVAVEMRARNQDTALEGISSSPLTQTILGELSETERAGLEAALKAELEAYREGEGYRLPGLTLLLRGRNPA